MGMMQRRKGRSFEQKIADIYRKKWPDFVVRRSLQAHRPYEPDVVVEGVVGRHKLWTECNDAAKPNPLVKLIQAERDIEKAVSAGMYFPYLPIVVWHRLQSREVNVTMRMSSLWRFTGMWADGGSKELRDMLVTMTLDAFLESVVP